MTKRQREHAAKMLTRRPKRPWDDRKEDACRASQLRLRTLFGMNLSDEKIAEVLGVDVQTVWLLRNMNCRRRRGKPVTQ